MKKILIFCFVILGLLTVINYPHVVYAESSTSEVEQELTDTTNANLDKIDFSNIESIFSKLDDAYSIFGSNTFKEKVEQLIHGQYFDNYDSLLKAIFAFLSDGVVSVVPMIMMLVALCVLSMIVSSMKASSSKGVGSVIEFVCYGAMVVILVGVTKNIITLTKSTLDTMQSQIQALLPILLTLLTAVGGFVSVSIYKPVVVLLTSGVMMLFEKILLPIFIFMFLFTVIGYINPRIKLKKFADFLSSLFKWVIGTVFTLFSGFLAIQGISAGKYDGISIKATKFAVKSYIPLIGGYLSDGLDFMVLSSVLIKNAIGLSGLLLMVVTILSPIIQLIVLKLGLQLTASIVEPLGNSQMTSFLSSCAKILIYPIVLILGMAFMYILTVAMMMCTANAIV